jgi:hypothetical protein
LAGQVEDYIAGYRVIVNNSESVLFGADAVYTGVIPGERSEIALPARDEKWVPARAAFGRLAGMTAESSRSRAGEQSDVSQSPSHRADRAWRRRADDAGLTFAHAPRPIAAMDDHDLRMAFFTDPDGTRSR